MELIKLKNINTLIEDSAAQAISMFMPTFRTGTEVKQNAIRYKNLIGQTRDKLEAAGKRNEDIDKLLQPAVELIDNAFWQHQEDGLAVFISNEKCYYFNLYHDPGEFVVVSKDFYIKPIIDAVTEDKLFYILALNQNNIRLFRCTRYDIEPVELKNIPTSIEEMLQYEDPEKSLQYHTGTIGTGKRPAAYHGQGTGSDASRRKKDIQRFFHMLDKNLREKGLHKRMETDNALLILAGIEELIPLYIEANSYPKLIQNSIKKNPEDMNEKLLHNKGWEVMDKLINSEKQDMMRKFNEMRSSPKTSDDSEEIIKAAATKRIDTLFLKPDEKLSGFYDENKNTVSVNHPENGMESDLINFAALETFRYNGKVITIKEGDDFSDSTMSAIFRF